jgi:predicted nucleic acid-binding protein
MARYSLDTNTLSYILRCRSEYNQVIRRFRAALADGEEFIICPAVYFELKRGLLHKDARTQMARLDQLVTELIWKELDAVVWANAAWGWAEARRRGRTPGDTDLLIAYHAHHFEAVLVTANLKDFESFPVQLENWASAAGASR